MDVYPVDSILVGTEEFVFTTHVTHQQLFYVHAESRSKILEDIMNKLETRYTHLRPEEKPLLNKRLGSLCAAKFTDDGIWYRARITGLLKNGHIEVQFVDYGNTDYVTEERIKAIDADLIKYPVQSYRCCLADVSCPQGFWTPELIIQFEDRVIDRRCRAKFVGENEAQEMYLLQLWDSDGNNINQLFGAVSRVETKAVQNGVFHGSGFKETSFDLGAVFQAAVVYATSPGLFWCQNTQFASDILILSEELSRLHMIQEMKPIQDVHKGTVCAAKFSEDDAWYRGIVHSVSGSKAKVYFVDYGNTELVSLDVICNLKPEMRTLPALAIKCRLNNVDSEGRVWRPEVIEAFEALVIDKEFEVKVVGKEGDVYIVTLFDVVDNKDIGIQLQSIVRSENLDFKHQDINCNKPTPSVAASGIGPSFNVGSKVDVYVSWIENPCDFWVQLNSAEELLQQMSQQLQEVYSQQQPLAQPTPGAFVVSRFSQDGMWYRSLVLKVLEDEKVRVLFIDYGNSDVVPVSDLRQVTDAFGQVIPLASRCCLAGVKPPQKGGKSWPPDAKTFLENLTENGCQCEILSETSSHKIVNLKVGSRDVARELLSSGVFSEPTAESKSFPVFLPELTMKRSQTEQVFVSHIESPKSFWCQVAKNIPLLQDLMKQLSQQYACGNNIPLAEPILGQVCIVFSKQDKLWYRAKITHISSSTYHVHFLDFGTSDVVPNCHVFVPEPTFMDLAAQAFHCGISVSEDSSLLTNAFKEAVCKKELRLQVLEVTGDRAVVELFDGKMKVSELLKGIMHVSKDAAKEVDFVPAKEILAGSTVNAFASFVVSPNKFFIHKTGVEEELGDLMDNIALLYNSDKPPSVVTHPHSGQPCVALYSEDGNWYRGRIVAVKGNSCTVLFVDFGNEDTVNNKDIRVLTPELAQVPVLSHKCFVHGLPETEWSEDALQYFEALVMEKELTCTFVYSSSVRVLVGSQDVASQLRKAGYGGNTSQASSPGQGTGSKLSQSDRETVKIGGGSDGGWNGGEVASVGYKHADSHSFGRKGDSETNSDRHIKYTDVRREESLHVRGRDDRESGGRNGRDSRFENGRRDVQSGDGRDSGGRRGRDSRYEDDRQDWQSDESRESRRGMDSRFESDRRDLQSRDGRDSRRGRDSRFEGDRRDWKSSEGRDSGSRGGPHVREAESGGFRDAGGRRGRDSGFAGSHGRETQLGEGRGQGNSRFGGSREFGGGHNDRRMTSQSSASLNTDFTYPETPSEAVSTILVHMDEDGTFYLQLPSMEKDILLVSRRVAGSYKGGSGPRLREMPVVGTVCCARFADDGNMYRAKVEDVQGSIAVLRYVDYGNTGECSLSDLKFLFPDLLQYPVQAFPCQLRGYEWSLEEAEKFAKATLDKDLKVTFITSTCPFQVDIMTPEGDLLKVLTGESAPPAQKLSPKPSGMPLIRAAGFGSKDPDSKSDFQKVSASPPGDGTNNSDLRSKIMPKQIYSSQSLPDETLVAFISHIGIDGFFYLQLSKDLPTLDSISEQLLALPDNIKHPDLSKGAACAAVFSEDSAWYRAEIIETHRDSLSVRFVDYGNEDTVSISSVKPLSRELLAYPPFAYKCQFSDLGALSTEAQSKLAEYLTEHQVTVTFSGHSPPFSVCIKTEEGQDLQDIVCSLENYRSPVVPTEVTPVGVAHIEDDGRFFVQLYQNYTAVKELQDALKTAGETELPTIESAQVDMPCCLNVEAGFWQRGKVTQVADDCVHVFLVDSGKTVITDIGSLRSMPVQFLKTPPYALECRLKGVEKWAEGLLEKFSEMTQDKILNATFHSQKFPLRVSLARSIEMDLLGLSVPPPDSPEKSPVRKASPAVVATPQTAPEVATEIKPAYISHVDTHGGFYVQTVDREEDLNNLADSLEVCVLSDSDHLNEAAAGDVVCAQFTEDDAWYRARIESCTDDGQFLIRFIDYGNSDVVGADRLKALPQELDISTVPPFAVKCRFFGVSNDLTPEQADKFREIVAEQTVNVVFRSLEDDIQEVDVSLHGLHVAQTLGLETQTFQPDLKKSPATEDDENEYFEAVEDLEESEEEPIVKKTANSGVMETTDASKCPGLSSSDVTVDVVDSASETLVEPASSGDSFESAKQEFKPSSFPACVKDGEPPDTAAELSIISDTVPVSGAAHAGDIARVSVSADDRTEVTVSHVDSPDKLYIQLDGNKPALDDMMDAMFEHFSSQSEVSGPVEAAGVGDVCAAQFEDESWYRVRIESLAGDGTCEIIYIDYGNTETVDVTSLQPLPESFKSILPWALKAKLGGVEPREGCWTQEAVLEMKEMVEEKHLLADILEVSDDGAECTVHLLDLGIPVHEELIKKGHAVAVEGGPVSQNLHHFYSDGDSYGASVRTDETSGCLESTHVEGDSSVAEDRVQSWRTLGCVASSLPELAELSVYVSHSSSTSSCHFWCQLTSSSDTLSEITSTLARIYGSSSEENTLTEAPCVGDVVVAESVDDREFYRAQVLSVVESDKGDTASTARVRFVDYGNESEVSQSLLLKFHEKLYTWPAQAFCCCLDKVQPEDGTWSPDMLQVFSQTVSHQELLLKLVGREQDGVILVDAVLQETGQSVNSLFVEAGLAKASVESQLKLNSKSLETSKAGDMSELETLEMLQPILESTTMVMSSRQDRLPTVSFEEADEEHFRSVKLSLHTEYDVVVSNDELPSCFHVRLLELQDQYLSLVTEIADHVASSLPGDTAIFIPEPGDACLVQHCGVWYRGLVTVKESDSWSVKSIDCGWVVNVPCDQLMALPAHLRELPAQSVPCYLAGIVSVELEWATDGITFFIDTVRNAKLCMYVLECADNGKYGVYLNDLDNTGSQSVNRALVDLGYAEVVPGSNIEVQIEMERTLDTDLLQDLEESFNEVSQLKCNADCDWDGEAMSSIAYDSENPLKDTYEDSDVYRIAKLEMDKAVYHLVQIPPSMLTNSEGGPDSQDKNCIASTDDNLISSIDHNSLKQEAVVSQKVRFDCASAVERIDKMGCVDNYPDEGLFAEYESLEDAVAWEDKHVSRDSEDDVHQSRPDATAHGGAAGPAEDIPKYENVAGTSVQNDAEVQTSCIVKSEAATTTSNSIEHDSPEMSAQNEDTARCGQPTATNSDACDDYWDVVAATTTSNSIEHGSPEMSAQNEDTALCGQPTATNSHAGDDYWDVVAATTSSNSIEHDSPEMSAQNEDTARCGQPTATNSHAGDDYWDVDAATTSSNSIEHDSPEMSAQNEDTARCGQPTATNSHAGDDYWDVDDVFEVESFTTDTTCRESAPDTPSGDRRVCTRGGSQGAADRSELSTESIEMMIEFSTSGEESVVLSDVPTELCERDYLPDHHEESASNDTHVSLAGQQRKDCPTDVSGIDLCGVFSCVMSDLRDEASLQPDPDVVPGSELAPELGCGTGDVRFVLAEDAAGGWEETWFRSPASSVDSTSDEYESCCEDVLLQSLEDDDDDESNNSGFTEISLESSVRPEEHNKSNYDTSTLLFSDSYVDSSMEVSSLYDISSTEGSIIDSDGMFSDSSNDTSHGTQDNSDSSHSDSSCSSASTVVTSSGSSIDDASWIHEISSSNSGSSIQTVTDLSALESDTDLLPGTGSVCEQQHAVTSLAQPETEDLKDNRQVPDKLHLEKVDIPNTFQGTETDVVILGEEDSPEIVIDTLGVVHGTEVRNTDLCEQDFMETNVILETVIGTETVGANIGGNVLGDTPDITETVVDIPGDIPDITETVISTSATRVDISRPVIDTPTIVDDIPEAGVDILEPICMAEIDNVNLLENYNNTSHVIDGNTTDAPGTVVEIPVVSGIQMKVLDHSRVIDRTGTDNTDCLKKDIKDTTHGRVGDVSDLSKTVTSANVQDIPATVLDIPGNVQDIPTTVPDISGNVQDIPTTVLDISGNVQDIPTTVPDISENVQDIPTTVPDISGNVQDIPTTVLDISGNVQDIPTTVLDISGNVQDIPTTVPDISGNVQDIPTTVLDISGNVQDIPMTLPDISGNVQDIPATVLDISGNVQDIPTTVPDISGNVQDIPTTVLDISGNVQDIPTTVLDISGNVQDIPTTVLDISGNVQYIPTTVLDISGNVQDIPTTVLDISGNVQDIPTTVLDISGNVQDIPTTVPDISENVQDISTTVPDISGNVQDIPTTVLDISGNVQDIPTTVLDISGNVQDIPTTVPDISGNVQDIPTTVLDISGNVQDIPTTLPDISGNVQDIPTTVLDSGNVQDIPLDISKNVQEIPLEISGNIQDMPDIVLDIPENVQGIPATVLNISANVLDIPTVLDILRNVQDISGTVLDLPGNVQEMPGTVLDISGHIQGIPGNVLDTPTTVPDIPKTMSATSEMTTSEIATSKMATSESATSEMATSEMANLESATSETETAGDFLPGPDFVCGKEVRSLVSSVSVDLTDSAQAPGDLHSGTAGLPDTFQRTQTGSVVLCEEDTPETVLNTSKTAPVAGIDSPGLPEPDITETSGEREIDVSDMPGMAHKTDTLSTDVCERSPWGTLDISGMALGITVSLLDALGAADVPETVHRTQEDLPDLSAKAMTETSAEGEVDIAEIPRAVVDIPTIAFVEGADKNSCVDDMPAEGNCMTSPTCDMDGKEQTHVTSVDVGASPVPSSANHQLDGDGSGDDWQEAQNHKTPQDDMPTGCAVAVASSCRLPGFMMIADSAVADNVCENIWNKSDDQGKAVSLNEWTIKRDQKLESFSDWVVTGVQSGICGEVTVSADTKINDEDGALLADCGSQLTESEGCSNYPDARVSDENVACTDVALIAAVCGPRLGTNGLCVGEPPDAAKPQEEVNNSDMGGYPEGLTLYGAEKECQLPPSHDDMDSVEPSKSVKDEELTVDAAGDAGLQETAEAGQENVETPEA